MVTPFVLTLTGAAQQLTFDASGRTPLRSIAFTADPANASPIYIGGPGVTSANWMHFIPAPIGGIPEAPLIPEFADGKVYLEDFYVIGANAEKIHLALYRYV